MTEEKEKPPYFEDLNRYQYANIAARFSTSEETAPFAASALEKLISGFNLDKDVLEGLKAGTFASKEGIETAINVYAGKYQKALNSFTLPEFYEVRFSTLKSVLGEEKANAAKEFFEKYKDQTIGSVIKKVSQAKAKIEDQTGLFDDKAKEEAKKTLEKLNPLAKVISFLENRKFEEMRADATKSAYKENLTQLLGV